MQPEQNPAQDLLQTMQALYGSPHIFQQVEAKSFRHVDQKYYQRTQAILETLGFRQIADIEDVTVSQTNPQQRTFIRVCLSNDRAIVAAAYHFPLSLMVRLLQKIGLAPKGGRVVDLETELSDGSFLVTSNTRELDTTADIPNVCRQQFPHNTTVETLLNQHRAKLRDFKQQGITPIQVSNYSEMIEAQHRLQAIKNGYRQSVGFISAEDIDRTAGDIDRLQAEVLKNAIHDLQRESN